MEMPRACAEFDLPTYPSRVFHREHVVRELATSARNRGEEHVSVPDDAYYSMMRVFGRVPKGHVMSYMGVVVYPESTPWRWDNRTHSMVRP